MQINKNKLHVAEATWTITTEREYTVFKAPAKPLRRALLLLSGLLSVVLTSSTQPEIGLKTIKRERRRLHVGLLTF